MKFLYPISLLVLISFYNNCHSYRSSTESEKLNSASVAKLDGVELYQIHCSSCHQPLEQSSKKRRTASQISGSIKNILQMKEMASLVALTDLEIKLIADALNLPDVPVDVGGGGKPEVVFQQPLGDRKFMAAKLKSLFSGGNAAINTTIDNWTFNLAPIFGSPCNRTSGICRGDESQNIIAPGIASSNVLRSGYRIKVCEAVLENDASVSTMLTQVGLTTASARSRDNLRIVGNAMTSTAISDAVIKDFQDIDVRLNGNGLESWRIVLLTLCKSSLFENF